MEFGLDQIKETNNGASNSYSVNSDNKSFIIDNIKKHKPHFIEELLSKRLKEFNDKGQVSENKVTNGSYIRVSEICGGCPRKIFYRFLDNHGSKNDVDFDFKGTLRMSLGNKLHDLIQDILNEDLKSVETRYYDHKNKITGSTDGILKSKKAIIEFKTAGLGLFNYVVRNNVAKRSHIEQVHLYMKMSGLQKAYIVYINRNIDMFFSSLEGFNFGSVIAENKRWEDLGLPDCVKVFEIDYTEYIYNNVVKKVQDIWQRLNEAKKDGGKFKPPAKISASKQICNSCEYYNYCHK